MANDKESTTKDEVLLSDRLSDKTQHDVVDSSPSTSDTSSTKTTKPKSSGNGLLWFVVLILFASVIAMAGAGYWYYMQQVSASQTITAAQQTNSEQIKAIESERATLSAALRDATKSNSKLEKAIAELQTQNANLTLQTESALEQIKNMEGRRPADWLIAEADYLVRMAGRKLWLESDVRTAILLLVNADKRLKSLADPSVLPVRAALAEDIQTLQQLNPVSQSSVALALTGMIAQIDKLPLDTFEKPEAVDAQDTTLSNSTDDWQDNLAKVWRSLVNDFLTIKTIEGPIEPVLSLEAQFLVKEQLRLQLMHAQTAALQSDAGLYNQSLQYAQTLLIEKFDTQTSQVSGFVSALQNLLNTDISRPIPSELASQQPLERLLDSRVKQVFGQGASVL